MIEDKELQEIINAYNKLVQTIDETARNDESERAYGGIIRAGKGTMLEDMAKVLVKLAWKELGEKPERLSLFGRRIKLCCI